MVQLTRAVGFLSCYEDQFFYVCTVFPPGSTDYHILSSDEVTAIRLEFKMGVFAFLYYLVMFGVEFERYGAASQSYLDG